jgi:hypothetical protein
MAMQASVAVIYSLGYRACFVGGPPGQRRQQDKGHKDRHDQAEDAPHPAFTLISTG